MTNDWKSYIGEYFAEKGVFRLDYLKDKLSKDCKEYIAYLDNFNGIWPKVHHRKNILDSTFYLTLEINLDKVPGGQMFNAPFIFGINVSEKANFHIIYSVNYSFNDDLKNHIKKVKDSDAHKYKEEELTEPERFEKEWLFQIINQRLINYIDSFQKDWN